MINFCASSVVVFNFSFARSVSPSTSGFGSTGSVGTGGTGGTGISGISGVSGTIGISGLFGVSFGSTSSSF